MQFPKAYSDIIERIDQIDPVSYCKTRNFIDGDVTRLSPYISRGVVSTKLVMKHVLDKGYSPYHIEKFLQELAWRDYWQQVWIEKGDSINNDLKNEQTEVANFEMPKALTEANTGIEAIDRAIMEYYDHGYLHNHIRMYIAAIACNIGHSHWRTPARWMYYHLIDGDWASNALSWQWVAGSNANKKYVANQANINRYCHTHQKNTFLDVPYEAFEKMEIPAQLIPTHDPDLVTPLPFRSAIAIDPSKPTFIYNYYHLDPTWRKDQEANRILLLEPSKFEAYPVAKNGIEFALGLSANIPGIQVYVGEFDELKLEVATSEIRYKEHPLNYNYEGEEDPREWMFSVKGYFPSFFAFWKKCRKELKQLVE